MFLAQVVNEVCAGLRPRDANDHRGIAQDGMQWNLARFRQTAPQHSDKRWTVAFLLGCQVRAMMARRRSVAVAVARAVSELGRREAALTIWRGLVPLLRRGHGHQSDSDRRRMVYFRVLGPRSEIEGLGE